VEQSIENMKTGAIGGAEYLKHKNCFHFSVLCSTDGTNFHVFGNLFH
jgi:hypothetical protein